MIITGLTGNIGSGKTTVSRLFSMHGVPVYHADERGKQFLGLTEVKNEVVSLFGLEILGNEGEIDRKKLAAVVFADKEKLDKLNHIIHPMVRADFRQWVDKQESHPYVIEEVAILFESGIAADFDKIVLVTAPESMRVNRVCRRDSVKEESFRQRARHQWKEKVKIPLSDYVIRNDETSLLIDQVAFIHKQLLKFAGKAG